MPFELENLGGPELAHLEALGQKSQKTQKKQDRQDEQAKFQRQLDAQAVNILGIGVELPGMAQKAPEKVFDALGHGAQPEMEGDESAREAHGFAQFLGFGDVALLTLFLFAFRGGFFRPAGVLLLAEHRDFPRRFPLLRFWRSAVR